MPLAGKPLLVWSILAAQKAALFDEIVVSTDGDEIAQIAHRNGANVVMRPDELATDSALPKDAVKQVVRQLENDSYTPDIIVLLQPTSPLRSAHDIQSCVALLDDPEIDSAVSFVAAKPNPMSAYGIEGNKPSPAFPDADIWVPRQKQRQLFHLNGAVYVVRTTPFLDDPSDAFLFGQQSAYVMPQERSFDIDTIHDFRLVESIISKET